MLQMDWAEVFMQGQFSLITLVQGQTKSVLEEHLINSIEESEDEREYFCFDELKSPIYLCLLSFTLFYR